MPSSSRVEAFFVPKFAHLALSRCAQIGMRTQVPSMFAFAYQATSVAAVCGNCEAKTGQILFYRHLQLKLLCCVHTIHICITRNCNDMVGQNAICTFCGVYLMCHRSPLASWWVRPTFVLSPCLPAVWVTSCWFVTRCLSPS